jgi:2',3'-cyclic-nucleotide 2'-phosphodiesterase (5'-nucleotidase family)
VSITGAKLKNVLDTSMKIANAQQAGTYVSLLHDRDLLYIGVTQKGKTYYVNGDVIEEARIYSIATDDLLAVGNSGYPGISDAGFAHQRSFATMLPIQLFLTYALLLRQCWATSMVLVR